MSKTFYIIDDHQMLRLGTSSWLTSNSDWLCAGSAGTHEAAFSDFEKFADRGELPSLVICDLNFYGENTGFDFIKELCTLYPSLKILVYSMFFAGGFVKNAISAGAAGYISKNANSKTLLEGMEKILKGDIFIQEELQPNLIKYNTFTDALTKREKEVMGLLLRHLSNEQISEQLGIKKRAVENYISSIYEKTGVNDRSELEKRYGE
ncbi:Response regulator [Treponema sp. JC4]|uniref:response regulator transcription factor n=1 Tax=Treponema sp. JC4 TaxID=1124982 RepID=UPI00025B0DD5|nr:response regulator transcription factor [Treponema sp. JC4]EID85368.1 Response regulator [Treponema sp. JC4]